MDSGYLLLTFFKFHMRFHFEILNLIHSNEFYDEFYQIIIEFQRTFYNQITLKISLPPLIFSQGLTVLCWLNVFDNRPENGLIVRSGTEDCDDKGRRVCAVCNYEIVYKVLRKHRPREHRPHTQNGFPYFNRAIYNYPPFVFINTTSWSSVFPDGGDEARWGALPRQAPSTLDIYNWLWCVSVRCLENIAWLIRFDELFRKMRYQKHFPYQLTRTAQTHRYCRKCVSSISEGWQRERRVNHQCTILSYYYFISSDHVRSVQGVVRGTICHFKVN